MLGEDEPRELVVGAIGRFWGPGVEWLDIEPTEFAAFDRPGYGKIAWGFTVLPYGKGRSILVDECRTRVTDPVSRERFRRYWKLVWTGRELRDGSHGRPREAPRRGDRRRLR